MEVARRGRERFPSTATVLNEVRGLAAMGEVAEVDRALDECLAVPPHPWVTPADVMETAALELRAHGRAEAAAAPL